MPVFKSCLFSDGITKKLITSLPAEIAQVVERRPEKPGVPSANLGLGTFFNKKILHRNTEDFFIESLLNRYLN